MTGIRASAGVAPQYAVPQGQQNPGTITGAEAGRGLPGDCVSSIPTTMPLSQQDLFAALSRAHSPECLGAYRRAGDDDAAVLARYLWNTQLCEALHPTLQALGVALRNRFQAAIARAYGRADWYVGACWAGGRQEGESLLLWPSSWTPSCRGCAGGDQARRRALQGEQVPAGEQLVSLFEPEARVVSRHKAGRRWSSGARWWWTRWRGTSSPA